MNTSIEGKKWKVGTSSPSGIDFDEIFALACVRMLLWTQVEKGKIGKLGYHQYPYANKKKGSDFDEFVL